MSFLPRLTRRAFPQSVALAFVLSGCAPTATPRYFFDLTPLDSSSAVWEQGRRVVVATSTSSRVRVSYAATHAILVQTVAGASPSDRLVDAAQFQVAIENLSEDTIEIDPGKFATLPERSGAEGECRGISMAAFDREKMLNEARISRLRVEQQENPYQVTGIEVVGAGLDAASGILSAFSKRTDEEKTRDEEHRERRRRDREEREENRRNWDASRTDKLGQWNDEIAYWSKEVLGRTALAPGQSVSGMVVFPFDLCACSIELRLPVGSMEHRIPFRQSVLVLLPDGRSAPLDSLRADPPSSADSQEAGEASSPRRPPSRRIGGLTPLD